MSAAPFPPPPPQLKIMTYNIQRGRSAVKKREILTQVVQALSVSQADIICLQEVWREQGLDAHQLEDLCRAGWRHRLWRPTVVFPGGEQGNAVLSHFAVTAWREIDLSIAGREPRGLLRVELDGPGGHPVVVFCVHLGLRGYERLAQVRQITGLLAEEAARGLPTVLAGDFNDWRGREGALLEREAEVFEALRRADGRLGRTFPSFLPVLPLDRIYCRGFDVVAARVVRRHDEVSHWSDHLPVEAVLRLAPPAAGAETRRWHEERPSPA